MNPGMYPTVAVIVLTWNQRDFNVDCVDSLVKLEYPQECLQIIVVDNGSEDTTVTDIRKRYPQVTILENGGNLGYAEGNNVGIRHALQGAAQYIMLLNNDTLVAPNMLAKLIAVADQQGEVGIVSPTIYYHSEPRRIWCAGAAIDWRHGNTARLQAEEIAHNISPYPQDVDFVSGCAICLKRQVVEDVGVLDRRFFMYYEETDWCIRAKKAGWRIMYVPDASVWHRTPLVRGGSSPLTDYYMNRNALLFFARHSQGVNRITITMHLLVRQIGTLLAFTVKSHAGQRLPNRNARFMALRDALLGRWGKMGADVVRLCNQRAA